MDRNHDEVLTMTGRHTEDPFIPITRRRFPYDDYLEISMAVLPFDSLTMIACHRVTVLSHMRNGLCVVSRPGLIELN